MIIYRFLSEKKLKEELVQIDDKISHHKLNEGPIAEASAYVEELKSQGKNNSEIEELLNNKNLPSLQEIGKGTMFKIYGWWSLNRKRNKIMSRLEKITRNKQ